MKTYKVEFRQAGRLIAEITTEAINAWAAIWQAEAMVKAKDAPVVFGDEIIRWNGLCAEARMVTA